MGESERSAVCWRFGSDKDLISHEKTIMSLADYFHFLSATKGVADMRLLNHTLVQKTYPPIVPHLVSAASFFWDACAHCEFIVNGSSKSKCSVVE